MNLYKALRWAPLYSIVMPIKSPALSALVASTGCVALCVGAVMWDIALDRTGDASDAAAKGAPALPVLSIALFAIFWALGRALLSGSPGYRRAIAHALAVSVVLVAIPAAVSIVHIGESPFTASTYVPWLIYLGMLVAVLLPGSLIQAFLLVPRRNKLLERSRER